MAASLSYNASWRWKELPSLVPQQERKWQLIDIVSSILCYLLFMVLVWKMWLAKRLKNFQSRPRETVSQIREVRKCLTGILNRLSLLPLVLSCEASLWSCRIILKFWFYRIFKYTVLRQGAEFVLKGSKPQNKTPSNVWDKDSLLNCKLQITYLLMLSQIHDSYMIQPS